MKKISIAVALLALTLSSCLSDLNLDPDTSIKYPGNWAIPLVHTRLNLGDLVLEDSLTTADPDGLVHIVYRQDSLFTQDVYAYTQIPEQDPVNSAFTVGSPDIAIVTNLGTFGGAKMKSITVSSGKLQWKASSPVSDTIEIKVKLLFTTLNGQVFDKTISANGMGETTGEFDISGLNFDLTQGTPAYNNLGFELGIVNSGSAPNGTQVDITLEFVDMAIAEATGYFGDRKIELPSGVFPTSLGVVGNLAQGLYLADPRVKIFTNSNIGLPLQLSPNIVGVSNSGRSVDLKLQPYSFGGSTVNGSFAQDTFLINTANSQIDQFIANIPEEIIFSGNVTLNPSGEPANDNFITQDGLLKVGLEVDLPLELKTKNMTIEQTMYNVDFGVEDGDVEFVEELTLGFRVDNGFPLEADLHMYFQDTSGTVLDSAQILLFQAASVDGAGNVTTPATGDVYLNFDRTTIENILKSDDIRIKVILNTTNGGTQVVRMLTDYYIDMIIGANVKLNYSL